MLKTFLIFCMFPLALSGCSLHQPLKIEPALANEARYTEQTSGIDKASPPMERWWTTFHDSQLDQLMAQLFASNLQLEEAFARTQQAQAAIKLSRSARWPQLSLGGQGSRELVPGLVNDTYAMNYRFSAQSSFELDLWGKLKNQQKATSKQAAASSNQLQTLYLSLSAQLADLYYFAIEQRAQQTLLQQTIDSYAETLQRVEERYRQGLVAVIDVYQARQNLSAAKANLPNYQKNLATTEHAIASLLGQYPGQTVFDPQTALPFVGQLPAGIPADLLQQRPDLHASFNLLEAADAELAAAIADRLPTLKLGANYGFLQNDFGIGAVTGSFWQLLVQPAVPLIDGGRRRAEVVRNKAVIRERLAAYRQNVIDAVREVEDALSANREEKERLRLLEDAVVTATASQRLALDNYLRGLSDYLPVLSLQRSLLQTQNQLLTSRRQLLSDRISLARALGGSWMNTEIQQRFATKEGTHLK